MKVSATLGSSLSHAFLGKCNALALLAASAIAALIAAPVLARQDQATPPPNPAVTSAPALVIRMKDAAYLPQTATIKIGQSVQFKNEDEAGHSATASDGSFDSGYLAKGEVWQTTFSRTGTVLFSDIYHPSMHGSIVVVVN